jgi:hypothetical protein
MPLAPHLAPRLALVAAVPLAALTLAACTSERATSSTVAAADTGRQCFFTRDVNNFQVVDSRTVYLRVGVNDIYRVTLFDSCPEARFTEGLAIRSRGGTSAICGPLDAELIAPSPTGPRTCLLNDIHKLSPQEVATLDPKAKP